MILKSGISGFTTSNVVEVDDKIKKFKAVCFAIANTGLYRVVDFDSDISQKNFFTCSIIFMGRPLFILLNSTYEYLSFASKVEYFDIEFVAVERLEEEFREHFRVMTLTELHKSPNEDDINQLNSDEIKQINYYESATVGEVIFNYWD